MEDESEAFLQVKVSSKTKHVVHFNVKAGDVVVWQFATKKKDIAFGVLFESTEVATVEPPPEDQVNNMYMLMFLSANVWYCQVLDVYTQH